MNCFILTRKREKIFIFFLVYKILTFGERKKTIKNFGTWHCKTLDYGRTLQLSVGSVCTNRHWCWCCWSSRTAWVTTVVLAELRPRKGLRGENGELNNKSKYLAVESSLELQRTLSGSSPPVLNRLSGCWVIVDREIPALWTRLLFAFACFRSPIEVASVNSPLRAENYCNAPLFVRHCRPLFAHYYQNNHTPKLCPEEKFTSKVLLWCWFLMGFSLRRKRKVDRKSTFTARIIFKSRSATLLNFADVAGDLIPPKITRDIACGYRRGRGAVDSVPTSHSGPFRAMTTRNKLGFILQS